MAYLNQQFRDALGSIEPSEDDKGNAPEAHRLVREALVANEILVEYGADPVLIGSYKRHVSIRRIKDVDVFVRLDKLPTDVGSKAVLDRFFEVLHAEFGVDGDGHRRTKRQDRSLQVSFPEYDLYVDAVPARPSADAGAREIPQKGSEDEWVRTNPEALTALSSDMNAQHDDLYVPVVKLLRQTRRVLLGGGKPGGFFIEMAAYQAFRSGVVTGSGLTDYYVSALREVSAIIERFVLLNIGVDDPTLAGKTISIRATKDELKKARERLKDASEQAQAALEDEDPCTAALVFRSLLGKEEDGEYVFPMPPGCNDDGTTKSSVISPGAHTVPAGTRTFG